MAHVYAEAPMTMEFCLDCHRDPAPHLRPQDRITDMEWRAASIEDGRAIQKTRDIHPPTECSGCHR
jgi:hypothetical protein